MNDALSNEMVEMLIQPRDAMPQGRSIGDTLVSAPTLIVFKTSVAGGDALEGPRSTMT